MVGKRLCDPGFLDGSFKSRSFLEALAGCSSVGGFSDLKPSSFRGLPSLWISEDEINALALSFIFSLSGFFPSKRPSLDSIRRFVGLFVFFPVYGFACCFWPRLVLLLVFLFFSLLIDCNNYDPFTFRGVNFGSNPELIRVQTCRPYPDSGRQTCQKSELGPDPVGCRVDMTRPDPVLGSAGAETSESRRADGEKGGGRDTRGLAQAGGGNPIF
ncbi:hypothetical protein MA16_Dca014214 [Dendrobium catenatum]|uniref:Uncharacterized protein n=1 Tax=Dendrobium catenatum TaxID=906689 RepID=A0A2I0VZA8_9ASPA|nr:hypothetical protein MA16_Dca014214 [Dendrobium catenatum]